uniref:Uncharacterized protein n=1 Tax=Knipowitschia caucasica TaxID=637954 RepID=A0AAV2M678_KNICA
MERTLPQVKGDQQEQRGDQQEQRGDQQEQRGDQQEQRGDQQEQRGDQQEQRGDQQEQRGDQQEQRGDQQEQRGDQQEQRGDQQEQRGDQQEQRGDQQEPRGESAPASMGKAQSWSLMLLSRWRFEIAEVVKPDCSGVTECQVNSEFNIITGKTSIGELFTSLDGFYLGFEEVFTRRTEYEGKHSKAKEHVTIS